MGAEGETASGAEEWSGNGLLRALPSLVLVGSGHRIPATCQA